MRQPTIYSHPYDDELCIVCGHPHSFDDGSGISQCCHCGHPEWEPEEDGEVGAVGGRLGMQLRMDVDSLRRTEKVKGHIDLRRVFGTLPTAEEIERVRYELAADTRTPAEKLANEDAYWARYGDIAPPCLMNGPGSPCRCGCGQERNDPIRFFLLIRVRAITGLDPTALPGTRAAGRNDEIRQSWSER